MKNSRQSFFEGLHELVNCYRLLRRLVYLSEGVCNHGLNILRYLIETDNLRCWLRFEAVQPVKKLYHHFQSFLLASLNMLTHLCPHVLLNLVTFECEGEALLLERDRVVEVELRSAFEHPWDSTLGEVPREGTQYVGKNERNIVRQGFGEDGGQSGECIVGANSDARDSAIHENENDIDEVDVFPYFISNTPLVGLILLKKREYHECRPIQAYQRCEPWKEFELYLFTRSKTLALTSIPPLLQRS